MIVWSQIGANRSAKQVRTAKKIQIICSLVVWPTPVRISASLAHSHTIWLRSPLICPSLRWLPFSPRGLRGASVPLRSGLRPPLRSSSAPLSPRSDLANQLRSGQISSELAKLCANWPNWLRTYPTLAKLPENLLIFENFPHTSNTSLDFQ